MSLNLHKSKSINIFTKLSKPKNIFQNENSSGIKSYKDFIKKESVLKYLKNFLTQREPSFIKYNFLSIKNLNNRDLPSAIQMEREIKNSSNTYRNNKTKSKSILDYKHNILMRNDNKIRQINSMKYITSLKHLYSNKNNFQKYPNNVGSFSPINKFRLMKINETLKLINPPCITKESNLEDSLDKKLFNNKLKLDSNNNKIQVKYEKNKNSKIKEIYKNKIDKVNSFQLLNVKKEIIKNNYLNSNDQKEIESYYIDDINNSKIFSGNKKVQDNIINNNYKNEILKTEIISLDKNNINYFENIRKENGANINKINENFENNEHLNYYNKYKMNIMENCINKLNFDYSDGNYSNTNIHNYLINDDQNKIIFPNKDILNEIENKNTHKNNISKKDVKKEQLINKYKLNQILLQNQIFQTDILENKENIKTENINTQKDLVLFMKDKILMEKNNLNNNIKKDSNNKKNLKINFDKIKSNYLNEAERKNLNENCNAKNKNYIESFSDRGNYKKNPEKLFLSIKHNNKNSQLIKKSKANLELLLDDFQNSEEKQYNENKHAVKQRKKNYINFRKSKAIEFLSKKSVIMPPNDYTPSSPFIYSF